MNFFFFNYSIVFFFFIFSLLLSFIIVILSFSVSLNNSYLEKLSAYECGFDPYEDARNIFDIRFYLIAIFFLVFDLETAYLFPYCVSYSFLSLDAYFIFLDFIFEVLIGLLYIWRLKALN